MLCLIEHSPAGGLMNGNQHLHSQFTFVIHIDNSLVDFHSFDFHYIHQFILGF